MRVAKALGLFASYALWRGTGLRPAGRVLVRALGSDDENLRTLAGILLVRAGRRSAPLLQAALDNREHLPIVLTIVGSLGDRRLEPLLRRFAEDTDRSVADSARQALRVLDEGQKRD